MKDRMEEVVPVSPQLRCTMGSVTQMSSLAARTVAPVSGCRKQDFELVDSRQWSLCQVRYS